MEDRSLEEALLPFEQMAGERPAGTAARLWLVLAELHEDMNALARSHPHQLLTDMQIDLLNGSMGQVLRLLAADDRAQNLRLLAKDKAVTVSDALLLLGHYRGSLRDYRVNGLGEGPFSF